MVCKPQSHRSITRVVAARTANSGTAMAGKGTEHCHRSLPISWPLDQGAHINLDGCLMLPSAWSSAVL